MMKTFNKILSEDVDFIINSNIPWKKFSGKTILISGANGFLPSYMVHTLFQLNKTKINTKVYALVRNKTKTKKIFNQYIKNGFLEIIEQDISQKLNFNKHIDFIIHAASQASPKYYYSDPIGTMLPNIIGTKNLLDIATKNSVESFLFFSSGEVYGQTGSNKINELNYGFLDPLDLRSCYAESKRTGESLCMAWFKQNKTPVKIARIFHTYGPGMNLDDGRVFADFVSDAVKNRNIKIKSAGTAIRPFCYIADATAAFFIILLKGKNGNAYNVSNPNCMVSVMELAKIISRLFPEKGLKIEKGKKPAQKDYMQSKIKSQNPDISKLLKLGWKPKFSIEEGFSRTITSYH